MSKYPQTNGPPVLLWKDGQGYPQEPGPPVDVDTSVIVEPRITNFTQRVGTNVGDLVGNVYNTTGAPITLVSVEVSTTGAAGPWEPCDILFTDGAYVFPTTGDADGEPFNVPIQINVVFAGYVYFKIEISY